MHQHLQAMQYMTKLAYEISDHLSSTKPYLVSGVISVAFRSCSPSMESSSSSTKAGCASDLDWLCWMAGSVMSLCIECMKRCSCVAGSMLSQGWKVRRLESRVTTLPLRSMFPIILQ